MSAAGSRSSSSRVGNSAVQQTRGRGKHTVDGQVAHAPVVAGWACALTAGNAGDVKLEVDRRIVIVLAPAWVGRAEQCYDWNVKRGGEVTRPAVGCYHRSSALDTRLAQPDAQLPDAQLPVCQTPYARVVNLATNVVNGCCAQKGRKETKHVRCELQ